MDAWREVWQREDRKWAWRLVVNGRIVATDHGQGYENKSDCVDMADRILGGQFSTVKKYETPLDK
ncbi:DUF1508 domain-containing protein [Nocardioides sp. CPCC 205120]|uniref:DUF1508 domain-containing protein n=1 Tax=Nocardioides sp. CPCC 205120 TaxID=3406462 RepID=UPI003B50E1F5